MLQWAPQIDERAFPVSWLRDERDQRCVRQPWRNFLRDVRRRSALRHFLDFAVRQRDVNLLHGFPAHPVREILAYRRPLSPSRCAAAEYLAKLGRPILISVQTSITNPPTTIPHSSSAACRANSSLSV